MGASVSAIAFLLVVGENSSSSAATIKEFACTCVSTVQVSFETFVEAVVDRDVVLPFLVVSMKFKAWTSTSIRATLASS